MHFPGTRRQRPEIAHRVGRVRQDNVGEKCMCVCVWGGGSYIWYLEGPGVGGCGVYVYTDIWF